ncbi:MAG: V-type ATP synthase subunit D [Lentisphaerae bacterium]|nr:MAG: V-type ATP synthase subunit D [Lentisphaerota bacterium]
MAKIKFSKTELKAQRDALKRFQRFLPTLQLKKQQLQMEIRRLSEVINKTQQEFDEARQAIHDWISLFACEEAALLREQVRVQEVVLSTRNIAGVDIPVLDEVRFAPLTYDLFAASPWVDRAIEAFMRLLELQIRRMVEEEQRRRIEEELRTTSQRVNLFEKVKIPECKENIRVIQIYLGDQQTAGVGRAKIAKNKLVGQKG